MDVEVLSTIIKQEAILDINGLYNTLTKFADRRSYDFEETANAEKEQDRGTELEIKFALTKDFDDYTLFKIEIKIASRTLLPLEVETQQGKQILNQGLLAITVNAKLVLDKKDTWKKNKFNELIGHIYNSYIIKNKIENRYWPSLKVEADEVVSIIKESLDLY
ncbi:MAG: hypothetical protein HYS32_00415 [Candidatus Woesearchaeota archaeon]|nr:MAG: hypothetical protein HYS32_00415 [Candidatus Woesearchaeota archaeon]